jgi:hypothetical protein
LTETFTSSRLVDVEQKQGMAETAVKKLTKDDTELLAEVGTTLFGRAYRRKLAKIFGVAPSLEEGLPNEFLLAAVKLELGAVVRRAQVLNDLLNGLIKISRRPSEGLAPSESVECAEGTLRHHLTRKESERKRVRELSHPPDAKIELALGQTGGNAEAAARILGCTGNWVRTHIRSERAKGRELGRRGAGRGESDAKSTVEPEFNGIEIAISISDAEIASAPPYQPTEAELRLNAVFEEFVADLLV